MDIFNSKVRGTLQFSIIIYIHLYFFEQISEKVSANEDTCEAEFNMVESDLCMTTSVETEDSRKKCMYIKEREFLLILLSRRMHVRDILPSKVCLMPTLHT